MEVQTHIDALRSLIVQSDDWTARYSTRHTRFVCMRLFNCHVEDFESMSNEAFALAMIAQNGNSVCFIPEDVWQAVKEEATKILTLQMVAGTFPPPKHEGQFSLVVDDENELPGWQPLALVLAKGYTRLRYWVDYIDGQKECDLYGHINRGDVGDIISDEDFPWNIRDWISAESLTVDARAELNIDINNLHMTCSGSVKKNIDFKGNICLGSVDSNEFAVESIIDRISKYPTPIVSLQN